MKTTPSPRGRALLHQTPVGAIVIVENGTAVTHVFFSRKQQCEKFFHLYYPFIFPYNTLFKAFI